MILVDANLLLYASSTTFPQHAAAHEWLDHQLNGESPVALPWAVLLAYMRIKTNPRAFTKPDSMSVVCAQVRSWLDCKPVWTPSPTARHAEILAELLSQPSIVHSNLVTDAHLAALAVEHNLTLCSCDADFAKFKMVRWLNPLD